VLDFCFDEAEPALAELAVLAGVARDGQTPRERARAFVDAVVALREDVGIAATSDKLRVEDYDYLTGLAVNEAVAYFTPRLLDAESTRAILAKITA
jgi:alcohol dehydrogenase class IV